ncbi:GNAT family N-acetyltransferase [Paenarthrobacter sp. CM16]|uniref:GNAT family N-acetyltransferase n=1 Tax=Paenarthrobacter sp. CM16 TaxID=2738447 RepID=UPI001552BDE5|nr:GNAT family N-acetyltransferase [Paenarthrobacter sp. CM16]NQD90869.1 GNAT family N-acetyltransferase [Paenarthrobacter sp. CM16]
MDLNTQSPLSWTFRAGTAEDHPGCADLWMQALALRDGTPPDPDIKRKALAKLTSPRGVLSIVESRSAINGFALAMDDTQAGSSRTAHIALLVVNPSIQARGVGRALLASITRRLITEGFTSASLRVVKDNLPARKLYEAAGWKAAGHGVFEDSGRPCVHYKLGLTDDGS